jgi:nucleotide-binding universal stress UspA family protein
MVSIHAELAVKTGHKNAVQAFVMSTGSARYGILCLAEKQRIDLIIMGSRGGGLLYAWGSTAMGVGYDAPCDVLVIRETE